MISLFLRKKFDLLLVSEYRGPREPTGFFTGNNPFDSASQVGLPLFQLVAASEKAGSGRAFYYFHLTILVMSIHFLYYWQQSF
ncbi:hypothetical protein BWI96_18555 [Siphonobacter sp. SORGH_AS_0500]|uniref:hypothetical protein n=1 Tax=Siphonobacter sp. SORGH_AS_0500 TaxID=1864824 RepID=UPI000CBF57A1|nr:hypothetical protein [Siphonobacter sp. SORGH_AS_0500]PKK35058.1 hypothetical protein BWI96_18555 [Siphonobacter sp. SORGH_AS_0500]